MIWFFSQYCMRIVKNKDELKCVTFFFFLECSILVQVNDGPSSSQTCIVYCYERIWSAIFTQNFKIIAATCIIVYQKNECFNATSLNWFVIYRMNRCSTKISVIKASKSIFSIVSKLLILNLLIFQMMNVFVLLMIQNLIYIMILYQ